MHKAIILEDEQNAVELLSAVIRDYCPTLSLLGHAGTLSAGLELIKEVKPDIVFADIELEDGLSFELFDSLESLDFQIIFTTAYDSYALRAFDYAAIHYLLKPYSPKDVVDSVSRLNKNNFDPDTILKLLDSFKAPYSSAPERIQIPTSDGVHFIKTNDILRIQADRSYSVLHTIDGDKLVASKSLKELAALLSDSRFFRTHDSHLINLDYVKIYKKSDGGSLIMENGNEVPVSRRNKTELLGILS